MANQHEFFGSRGTAGALCFTRSLLIIRDMNIRATKGPSTVSVWEARWEAQHTFEAIGPVVAVICVLEPVREDQSLFCHITFIANQFIHTQVSKTPPKIIACRKTLRHHL